MFTRQRDDVPRLKPAVDSDPARILASDPPMDSNQVSRPDSKSMEPNSDATTSEGSAADPGVRVSPTEKSSPGSRYRIGKFIAAGGLGEVFEGRDRELARVVAIKRVKANKIDALANQRRLIREARITAQLEHPGIVPVHGLCRDEEGNDFYVMRKVTGMRMDQAISLFHESGPRNYRRSGELRRLLRRFIQVCETVQYAHTRGVIHRDIKPDNIMFRRYGETLLLDWGLAKFYSGVPLDGEKAGAEPKDLLSDLIIPDQPDQPSQKCGTPEYMSPEQILLSHERIGPRSDVFSLGASLYHVVTGVLPQRWAKGDDGKRSLLEEEVTPARQLNPDVPRPLEAICCKAMSYLPDERYQSAAEMAEELQRWLDDEAVLADEEPVTERLARLVRRRQTRFAAAFGALFTAFVTVSGALVNRSREEAESARKATDIALKEMTESRNAAANILASMLNNMPQPAQISSPPYMIAQRKSNVDGTLENLEALRGIFPHDINLKVQLALQQMERGLLSQLEGDLKTAEKFFRLSDSQWGALVKSFPTAFLNHEGVINSIGSIKIQEGRPRDAIAIYEESIKRLEQPTGFSIQISGRRSFYTAMAYTSLSTALMQIGETTKAMEAAGKADLLWKAMIAEDSLADEVQNLMYIRFESDYASTLLAAGQAEEALARAEASVARARRTLNGSRTQASQLSIFSAAQIRRCRILRELNRLLPGARNDLEEVVAIQENLILDYHSDVACLNDLAEALRERSLIEAAMGLLDKAVADAERAVQLLQSLLKTHPQMIASRESLAEALDGLARLKSQSGENSEVESILEQASALERQVLELNPDNPLAKSRLKEHQERLGSLRSPKSISTN